MVEGAVQESIPHKSQSLGDILPGEHQGLWFSGFPGLALGLTSTTDSGVATSKSSRHFELMFSWVPWRDEH